MAKAKAKKADPKPDPKTLARAGDPETSRLAAESVADAVASVQRWAARCVKKSPGKTSRELAELYCPTDPRKIGRRLAECEKLGTVVRGKVRKCKVSGKKAATWEAGKPFIQLTLF